MRTEAATPAIELPPRDPFLTVNGVPVPYCRCGGGHWSVADLRTALKRDPYDADVLAIGPEK